MNIPEKKQMNPIRLVLDKETIEVTKPIAIINNTVVLLEETDVEQVKARYPNALCEDQVK